MLIKMVKVCFSQFFVISQLCIHENLVRIQPLVHKILCRQESVTLMLTSKPTRSHQKQYVPLPVGGEDIKISAIYIEKTTLSGADTSSSIGVNMALLKKEN